MRYLIVILLSFQFSLLTFAQTDTTFVDLNYNKKEVYIKMRDGVRLYTSIYTPKDASKRYAIMINRTPYCVCPYGDSLKKESLGPSEMMMKEKYIFVYQDVRGRYMSEGEFLDVRPYDPKKSPKQIDESSDTYDTVDWLIKNIENNNGNVGIWGISYPGFYASMGAIDAHSAVKAVSPQAPVTNWFLGDDFHHNGAFFLSDAFNFYSFFGQPRPVPTPKHAQGFQMPTPDGYDFYLKAGPIKNLNKNYFKGKLAFWNDLMKHPNYDTFWQKRDVRQHLSHIKPATMVVGGFFDAEDCYGALETYKSIEKQSLNSKNTLVMGPWFHGGWARVDGSSFGDIVFGSKTSEYYRNEVEAPFFSHYLYGKGNDPRSESLVFDIGADAWHKFEQWPPANMKLTNYNLSANGTLSTLDQIDNTFSSYISDPNNPVPHKDGINHRTTREYMIDDQRFASRRPDVVTYEMEIETEPLQLAGPIYAELYVSTNATDADFIVKIIDLYPDSTKEYQHQGKTVKIGGYQMLVRGEVMRAKYRESFENPTPLIKDKIEKVRFYIPDVAHTFRPGHKLMIQIQSSWFPLVDRNPQKFCNIYEATEADFQQALIRIHEGGKAASRIELPVVK